MVSKQELQEKQNENLKQEILKKEEKALIFSEKFVKIENQVKKALSERQTDKALSDLTFGALYLGVSDIHYEVYEYDVKVRFRID